VLDRKAVRHLAVVAIFAVVTIVASWPMFPDSGGYLVDKQDPLLVTWELAWQNHALATNPMGLLDANINYPFQGTLAFNEISFTEALIAAPVYGITGNPVLALNFVVFVAFILAGYGTWLLVRELTGSGWAGLIAGMAYAFSFYMLNNLTHPTIISAEWLPFMLLAAYKLLWTHSWRWAGALTLFFALQALCTHYLAYYSAILLALFVICYFIMQRGLFSRGFWVRFAASMAGAAALVLPLAVAYQQVQEQYGFGRDLFQTERYSNALTSFLAVFRANPLYQALLSPFADHGPWPLEHSAFPGLGVLVLGCGGAIWAIRRGRIAGRKASAADGSEVERSDTQDQIALGRHAIFFVVVAITAAVLSLGPVLQLTYPANYYDPNAVKGVAPLPYTLLFDWVPGFASMRTVSRIDVLIALSLAVLAGIGGLAFMRWLGRLRPVSERRIERRLLPVAAVLVALVPVAESWSAPLQMSPVATREAVPPAYRWLASQPPAPVAEYPMQYHIPGDPDVAMGNTYQYYSTYDWQPTINGSVTIKPFAYSAVIHETVDCFPCPRSVDTLWAMGVKYVVAHLDNLSAPQLTDFNWRSTHVEGNVLNSFTLVKTFGNDRVYEIKSPGHLDQLAHLIPAGASILLGSPADDPIVSGKIGGGYMAAAGYYLRNEHAEYGDPSLTFGQPIQPVDPKVLPDYALLWAGQDPSTAGYRPQNLVWSNGTVSLYSREPIAKGAGGIH
jgi:hypothetical protein